MARFARRHSRFAIRSTATLLIVAVCLGLGIYVVPKLRALNASETANQTVPEVALPSLPVPGQAPQTGAPVPTVSATPSPTPTASASPSPTPGTPTPTFPGNLLPIPGLYTQPGRPSDALAGWAASLIHLGIPHVALQAYGYAEVVLARAAPQCHLSWTLLAGIGKVESNHGRSKNALLNADGTSTPPVLGIPLDGSRSDQITDTDGGLLDGNATYDHAVGPMQFIPSTWKKWGVDADFDRKADPFDIDDAALAAGYYLCAGGRDLATGADWWSAVYSYNHTTTYVVKVYTEADRYGRQSQG